MQKLVLVYVRNWKLSYQKLQLWTQESGSSSAELSAPHSLLTLTFVWQVNICTLHKVSKMFIFVSWYQFSQLITAISYVAIVFINECSSFYKQTQCFFPEVSWEVLRSCLHRLVQRNLLLLCSCSKLYGCEPGQSESKWKAARLRLVAGAAHPFIWLECFSDLIVKLVSPHTCVVWVS